MEKLIRTVKVIILGIKSLIDAVLRPYKDEKLIKWTIIIFFFIIFIKIIFFLCVLVEVSIKYYNLPGEYVDIMDVKNRQNTIRYVVNPENIGVVNPENIDVLDDDDIIEKKTPKKDEKTLKEEKFKRLEEYVKNIRFNDRKNYLWYKKKEKVFDIKNFYKQ